MFMSSKVGLLSPEKLVKSVVLAAGLSEAAGSAGGTIQSTGAVFGGLIGISLVAAARTYLNLNWHGWESNRLLAIGIGGGLGWFMMLNVWGIIWRAQKRLIRWTQDAAAGTPMPAEAPRLAQLAQIVSRTNFVLSFPMLLFMAIASHYPVFGR